MFLSRDVIAKDLFLDIVWEILYFPVWWYSRGLKKTAIFCWRKIADGWEALALTIHLTSFFKPMYGQRGIDAFILSLFTRFLWLVWHFFLFSLWFCVWLFVILTWLILPLFTVWQMFD